MHDSYKKDFIEPARNVAKGGRMYAFGCRMETDDKIRKWQGQQWRKCNQTPFKKYLHGYL